MQYNYKNLFTYELLYDLYINQKLSSRQIAKLFSTSKTKVLQDLRRYELTEEIQLNTYKINEIQNDFIIGSILGDGTFCTDGGDYRMSFRQAENQKDYLMYKFEIMEEFCKKKSVGISDGNKKASKNEVAQLMYYFHTRALPIFNTYKNMSTIEAIRELNGNSFSIWLMDDGTFKNQQNPNHTPYYTLSAKRFTEEEFTLAHKILEDKLDLRTKISYMKKDYYKNNKKYIINGFYFPTSETEKIRNVILTSHFGERLKTAMSYKIFRKAS
jgi:hypothetical protein